MLINISQWKFVALGFSLVGIPAFCSAVDSTSLELGTGNKTKMVRAGVQWKLDKQWWRSNGTHIGAYWDLSLAHWRGEQFQDIPDARLSITSIGITPVFRLQNDNLKGPYAEIGIGAHLLSAHYDNNGRQLSTRFQFGDHFGIGYVFPNNMELGLKLQHFSNAGIKKPNDGVNFFIVGLRYPI
ncbi:MAG TPA: acyloxyacyl hydrolase [Noviherbaspirillum sp.]|nr:acyloxyacyl hydrolase [Noviherbaspirillum sp.]